MVNVRTSTKLVCYSVPVVDVRRTQEYNGTVGYDLLVIQKSRLCVRN